MLCPDCGGSGVLHMTRSVPIRGNLQNSFAKVPTISCIFWSERRRGRPGTGRSCPGSPAPPGPRSPPPGSAPTCERPAAAPAPPPSPRRLHLIAEPPPAFGGGGGGGYGGRLPPHLRLGPGLSAALCGLSRLGSARPRRAAPPLPSALGPAPSRYRRLPGSSPRGPGGGEAPAVRAHGPLRE